MTQFIKLLLDLPLHMSYEQDVFCMALEFLEDVITYRLEISFPTTYRYKLYSLLPPQFARKTARKLRSLSK